MSSQAQRACAAETLRASDLRATLGRVAPFTMVPEESLVDLANLVRTVLRSGIPGDFVECGVWRGGASFLVADLLRQAGVRDRKVWLLDSFEGMPLPQAVDGPAAQAWVESRENPWYRPGYPASLDQVRQTAAELGLLRYTEFVKGWFEQTLPTHRGGIGPIAILRLDCDWYASVRSCLENLYDQVADGGFVILDDYYVYDGCAIAVHEFLGARRLGHRIESVAGEWGGCEYHFSARFRKGQPNWRWNQRRDLASQEISQLIPPESTVLLVDDGQLGDTLAVGRRVIPFLERNGEYWGAPPDDRTAITELDRLRRLDARFLVFAWPAFWWLECYPEFHRHLRETFTCVVETERIVAFELRR